MLDHLSQDLPVHCDQLTFLQLADQRHQHHCSATSAATAAEFKKCLDCVIFPATASFCFCFYVQLFRVLSRPPSVPILILVLDWLVLSGNFWFSSDANAPKLHVSTFDSLAQNIGQRRMNWSDWEEGMWRCNLYCFRRDTQDTQDTYHTTPQTTMLVHSHLLLAKTDQYK